MKEASFMSTWLKGNVMTFESNQEDSMVLRWRNYVFKRQP